MEEFKPNSHKYKEEQREAAKQSEKRVERIVTSNARVRKKTEMRKVADVFISEDVSNVKNYVLMDVLVPAIKKAISDIVTNGVDMILYGESGRTKKNTPASKISYRSFYEQQENGRHRDYNARSVRGYEQQEIVLDTRGEAEDVLSLMDETLSRYGLVRVADLYEAVGITGNYTDNNYGWTNLRNAGVIRVRDGYLIKMPKAMPLD